MATLVEQLRQSMESSKRLSGLRVNVQDADGRVTSSFVSMSDTDAAVTIKGGTSGAASSTSSTATTVGAPSITQAIVSGTSVVLDGAGPTVQICTPGSTLAITTANLAATVERTLFILPTGADVALTFPTGWRWVGFPVGMAPDVRAADCEAVVTIYSKGSTDADVTASWDTQY